MVTIRPSWDEYFMEMAHWVSARATCSRLQVGAVVVQDKQVIGTGYNGASRGIAHCVHTDDTPCRISVHAEANAVLFAQAPTPFYFREMYVTHAPCFDCAKLILNAEIHRVVYSEAYRSSEGLELLDRGGLEVVQSP